MGTAVEERGGTQFYGVGYGIGRVCTVWHDAVPSGTTTVKGHGGTPWGRGRHTCRSGQRTSETL